MVADGHTGRIANVDISPVVTEHMREKHASLPPNVSWEVADATKLTAHGNASFDAVIDKGTLDALMVRSG
jgi:RAT1-interacting protein